MDFTGGMSETFNLRKEESLPHDLWDIIRLSHQMGSLLGCGILVSGPSECIIQSQNFPSDIDDAYKA